MTADRGAGAPQRVLFVTWDGPEYQYLESLFLPIFAALRDHGFHVDVLQFTWGSQPGVASPAALAAERLGIGYEAVEVIRKTVAAGSLVTAVLGARKVRSAVKRNRSDIVLARSTLPALATLLARRRGDRWRFLFDLDGLPTDERVEFAGLDPRSPVARLQWAIERKALQEADAVTTRSMAILPLVLDRGAPKLTPDRIFRVPNCRDEHHFVPADAGQRLSARRDLGLPDDAPVVGYVGSTLSGKYRGDALLDFFAAVRSKVPETRLLILTAEPDKAAALVADRCPLLSEKIVIRSAPANDVPYLLGATDVGTAFIEATASMRAAAAVKLGEYLLCGLPVVATRGIGDVDRRLGEPSVLFLDNNGASELQRGSEWVASWIGHHEPHRQQSAREAGLAEYGLAAGAERYAIALRATERNRSTSRGA